MCESSTSKYLLILHSCGWPKYGHHVTDKGIPHTFSVNRKENLNLSNRPIWSRLEVSEVTQSTNALATVLVCIGLKKVCS